MAISNSEKQKRFYQSKTQSGQSKISCWLSENDTLRLKKLMEQLGYAGRGKKQEGYSDVISLALKSLEIDMAPPGTKNLVRYGLLYLNNETKSKNYP